MPCRDIVQLLLFQPVFFLREDDHLKMSLEGCNLNQCSMSTSGKKDCLLQVLLPSMESYQFIFLLKIVSNCYFGNNRSCIHCCHSTLRMWQHFTMSSICKMRGYRDMKMPYMSRIHQMMYVRSGRRGKMSSYLPKAVAEYQAKKLPSKFTVTTPLYYVNACTYTLCSFTLEVQRR